MASMKQQTLGPMEVQRVGAAVSTTVNKVDSLQSTTDNKVDRDMEWVGLASRALGKSGYTQKTAGGALDVDKSLLSAQLNCAPNRHLSFRKMWRLGPEFWRELILLILEFHDITIGSTQQDQEDAAVGRLVREVVTRCR